MCAHTDGQQFLSFLCVQHDDQIYVSLTYWCFVPTAGSLKINVHSRNGTGLMHQNAPKCTKTHHFFYFSLSAATDWPIFRARDILCNDGWRLKPSPRLYRSDVVDSRSVIRPSSLRNHLHLFNCSFVHPIITLTTTNSRFYSQNALDFSIPYPLHSQ